MQKTYFQWKPEFIDLNVAEMIILLFNNWT